MKWRNDKLISDDRIKPERKLIEGLCIELNTCGRHMSRRTQIKDLNVNLNADGRVTYAATTSAASVRHREGLEDNWWYFCAGASSSVKQISHLLCRWARTVELTFGSGSSPGGGGEEKPRRTWRCRRNTSQRPRHRKPSSGLWLFWICENGLVLNKRWGCLWSLLKYWSCFYSLKDLTVCFWSWNVWE